MKYPEAAAQYMDSIHGRALLKMGLIVAPSCNDCHGVHDIKRSVDRDSPINHANVAKTCGKCHVGIEEIYNKSVHGQLLAKGDKRGPVCTDCHTAHEIETPAERPLQDGQRPALRQVPRGPARALPRHLPRQGHGPGQAERRLRRRRLLRLPRPPRRAAAVQSRVAPLQGQHPGHLPAMSSRAPTPASPSTSPTPTRSTARTIPLLHCVFLCMTGLLVGVFAFFGAAHRSSGCSARSTSTCTTRRQFREAKIKTQDGRRVVHPLRCRSSASCTSWWSPASCCWSSPACRSSSTTPTGPRCSSSIIGGAETARALHRFGAIVTFLYFGLHLASLVGQVLAAAAASCAIPQTGKLQPQAALAACSSARTR